MRRRKEKGSRQDPFLFERPPGQAHAAEQSRNDAVPPSLFDEDASSFEVFGRFGGLLDPEINHDTVGSTLNKPDPLHLPRPFEFSRQFALFFIIR